jgi:hypothetical protein
VQDFEDLAPLLLTLDEIQGEVGNGRSRPLWATAADAAGARHNLVLKLRHPGVDHATPWPLCIVRELVGSLIAKRLGIPVPQPAIVEVKQEHARLLASMPNGARLAANIGTTFGSQRIDMSLEVASAPASHWRAILWLDAMSLNSDRHGANPNALWTGSRLIAIDHGHMVPSWTFAVDRTDSSSLYGEVSIRGHAGGVALKRTTVDFTAYAQEWAIRITADFLAWVRAQVPQTWASASDLDQLFAFLGARVTIAERQARELQRVLTEWPTN